MTSRVKRPAGAAAFAGLLVMVLAGCAPHPAATSTTESASSVPPTPSVSATPSASPSASASPPAQADAPSFNKNLYSIDDPTSIWVVVDKLRPLRPTNYIPKLVTLAVAHTSPPQMTAESGAALVAMFAAADGEGAGDMQDQNSYRSFVTQTNTHNRLVASLGEKAADAQSARPGYSEHQTGLAVDIGTVPSRCAIAACFGQLPQGVWLAKNSWRFGYILRYPADKTAITGYVYEPWHFRYVGVALSTEMHTTGVTTLEEFFGVPAAPAYAG